MLPILSGKDRNNAQLVFPDLKRIELQLLQLFEIVHEIEKFLIADDVYPLRIVRAKITEHQPQSAPNGLFRQNVRLCCVRAQSDHHRHISHVPTFTQHQH